MRIQEAKKLLEVIVKHNLALPPDASAEEFMALMMLSSPGVGKSTIGKQVFDAIGGVIVDERLAQSDPTSVAGWDIPNSDRTEMTRIPPRWYINATKNPDVPVGLFLDELPQAMTAIQNIAGQIVHERRIGPFKLPPNVVVMAAGNSTKHKSGTVKMPMQLVDRFLIVEVEPTVDDTVEYFNSKGVDARICGYLKWKPEMLSQFETDVNAFPSPRSWEKTATVINLPLPEHLMREAVAGTVGEAAAVDLAAFLRLADKLPTFEEIIADPMGVDAPEEASMRYAVTSTLTQRVDAKSMTAAMTYIDRFKRDELKAYLIMQAIRRDQKIAAKNDAVKKWVREVGIKLFSE